MFTGEATNGAILRARAERSPDHEFLRFESGGLTAGALDERADRVANGLAALGLAPGDRVAVQLPNGPDYLAAWFGIARAGMVEVPVNVGLRGDLLAHALRLSETRAIVIDAQWLDRLEPIRASLPDVRHVVVVGEAQGDGITPFAELLAADATVPSVVVRPWDPSVVLFTSGTTGPSKGALLSHNATVEFARSTTVQMGYRESETLFTAFPLFHINARYTSVMVALGLDEGSLVLHDRFSASRFWDVCRAEGVTAMNFMGALLMMLLKQPERDDDLDNPVRTGFGAPAPALITPPFEARFGVTLCETYGQTEIGVVIESRPGDRRIGAAGKPGPGFEIELHDEHDLPVAQGEIGEIVVRPKHPHTIIEEYVGMPEATLKATRGFWYRTGDRGRFDADGWLYYVDRTKDAIRRRGENISSWEVEQVLNEHPDVEETAVIGVPSELTEEEVLAVVKCREGRTLDPVGLLDFAQARLAHFAVPRYVRVVDALPKNVQQRIQKVQLREAAITADTWDRESVGYVVTR